MLQAQDKSILKIRKCSANIGNAQVHSKPELEDMRRKIKKINKGDKEGLPPVEKEGGLKGSKSDSNICSMLGKLNNQNKDSLPVINPNKETSRRTGGQAAGEQGLSMNQIKSQLESLLGDRLSKKEHRKEKSLGHQDRPTNTQSSMEDNHVQKTGLLLIQSWKIYSIKSNGKTSFNEKLKNLVKKKSEVSLVEGHKLEIKKFSPTAVSPKKGNNLSQDSAPCSKKAVEAPKKSVAYPEEMNPIKTSGVLIRKEKRQQRFNQTLVESPLRQTETQVGCFEKREKKVEQQANRLKSFSSFVGLCNWLSPSKPSSYKFYIGKGNNDELPRRVLKRRKWVETSNMSEANLVWTQRKQAQVMDTLKQASLEPLLVSKNQVFEFQANNRCYEKILLNGSGSFDIMVEDNKTKLVFKGQSFQLGQGEEPTRMHNHLSNHQEIAYKKLLFMNLKEYYLSKNMDPFVHIPLTFHIQSIDSHEWGLFVNEYDNVKNTSSQANASTQILPANDCANLWILKPGENTNRGNGIQVEQNFEEIKRIVEEMLGNEKKQKSTVIVQKYINPFLYHKRKFDIRCFALVTVVARKLKVYWYEQGYIRTSCKAFNITNFKSKYIHLTNDAVQKFSNDYGKYEPGNKLSFEGMAKYIEKTVDNSSFNQHIYPQMVSLAVDVFESSYNKLHESNKDFCFEVFGFDFMIDQSLKVWLIEVNRNPCLETDTFLLDRIISSMLENAFRIAVDPIFPLTEEIEKSLQKRDVDSFNGNRFKIILEKTLSKQTHIVQRSDDEDSD